MALELDLGKGRLQRELTLEANAFRNVAKELVDRVDADRREHRLAVGVSQREVAHSVSSCARYAAASSSESTSEGSASLMRTSQPSPYGSSLTVSGSSTTLPFTSRTLPESGAIRSETALTDSTSPYESFRAIDDPWSGAS